MALYSIGWNRLPTANSTNIPQKTKDKFPAKSNAAHYNKEQFQNLYRPTTKVSIIIPARNEAANIEKCLQSILKNNYPKALLEIILVNDFSTDDTAAIATKILEGQGGKVLNLKDYLSPRERLNAYKKKALTIAIEEAVGALIITTDADCICPPGWIHEIVAVYEQRAAKFIIAPVNFIPATGKNGLYYFQSLDFMTMQGITAAGKALDIGCLCNGANLAFSKVAFNEVGGYQGIDHIASGDDMLLLQKIKKRFPNSVQYLKSPGAIVETPCQPSISAFFNQRIRWASKSDKYEDKLLITILVVVYLFNLSLVIIFIASFFQPSTQSVLCLLAETILLKTAVEIFFLLPVAGFYHKKKELLWFPLLQPLHILYIIVAGFLGKFGSYQWKDRKTH